MSYEAHKENYKGLTIRIVQDDDAMSPAEWDEIATIYTRHNRYFAIGEDLNKIEGQETADKIQEDGGELLPVYAYVHSGVALSTGAFGCPWDSGQCGFIAMTKKAIIENWGDDSEETRKRARESIKGIIENWNSYFAGNVWGYIVEDKDGEHLDSCWGFYGDYDEDGGALTEARDVADYHAKKFKTAREAKLKALIAARAPLIVRENALTV